MGDRQDTPDSEFLSGKAPVDPDVDTASKSSSNRSTEHDTARTTIWRKLPKWSMVVARYLAYMTAAAILFSIAALILRILWAPTEIGTPTTESQALIHANERLLDMAKWTISTILLIGGGLIGLNWYSNEHRYREDRKIHDSRITSIEESRRSEMIFTREQILNLNTKMMESELETNRVITQVQNLILRPDESFPDGGYVSAVMKKIGDPNVEDLFKKRFLDTVGYMFSQDTGTTFMAFLGLDHLPELADEAEKLGYSEHAALLRQRHREHSSLRKETMK